MDGRLLALAPVCSDGFALTNWQHIDELRRLFITWLRRWNGLREGARTYFAGGLGARSGCWLSRYSGISGTRSRLSAVPQNHLRDKIVTICRLRLWRYLRPILQVQPYVPGREVRPAQAESAGRNISLCR
jgi:hypothetical protein